MISLRARLGNRGIIYLKIREGSIKETTLIIILYNFALFLVLNSRNASSLVTKFDDSINKLPLREAVRYVNQNMKWTAEEFKVRYISPVPDNRTLRKLDL